MYNIIAIMISLVIPLIVIRKDFIKNDKKIKRFLKQNKYQLLIYCILVIGFLTRLVGIVEYPAGLNQDEASAGYEAWSILHYGIDRHNQSFPIHFIAWGSGQNVLYSYIMIPFIAILGLNELAIRLPMAMIGCISLILVYNFFKKYNKKLVIIGVSFFVICPWHIMKSRWGLESNLFPDMVLISVYMILTFLRNKKILLFYIGMAFLSLSVYSYGTSYMFLPIFMVILLIYLLKTKRINWKNAMISMSIAGIIALPMILFVLINIFDLNEIHLGNVTIPRVYKNRFLDITNISNIINNFIYNVIILIQQNDGLNYNCISFYGTTYICSLPFTIIGLYRFIKYGTLEKNVINIWFFSSIMLSFICEEANINRLNIIFIPLIMYTIEGIYYMVKNCKNMVIPIFSMYVILFGSFINQYIYIQGEKNSSFVIGFEEPIQYVNELDVDKIYIKEFFIQPYIYILFYTQTNVYEYYSSVEYNTSKVAFESIKSFGKYNFYLPEKMNEDNVAYMVPIDYQYDEEKYKATYFDKYIVLEQKK